MSTSFLFYFFFKSQAVLTASLKNQALVRNEAILTGLLLLHPAAMEKTLLQMPLVIYGEL